LKIVPDTSTLIINSQFLFNFLEKGKKAVEIILPLTVLKELGKFKHESSERGKQARDIFRYLKKISKEMGQTLAEDIHFDNGSILSVEIDCKLSLDTVGDVSENDARIICVAKKHNAVLYTQDTAMEIIANALSVETNSEEDRKKRNDMYEGVTVEEDTESCFLIDKIYKEDKAEVLNEEKYIENQYVILKSGQQSIITQYRTDEDSFGYLHKISEKRSIFKVKPNDVKQKCALDLLTDDDIRIAGLIGNPGTGKTYLSLAAALDYVLNKGTLYKKLIIIKSAVGVGGEKEALGFLPGEMSAKIEPIFMNLTGHLKTFLNDNNAKNQQYVLNTYIEKGVIELKPVQYIRGENFSECIVLIDELQNFPLSTVKTLLTRVNYNTSKVIFTGDNEQVDSPYLNSFNNGLYNTVEKLKGKNYFGLITLDKSCRGEITEDIVELFE
jgi:PhoH-like ATPase